MDINYIEYDVRKRDLINATEDDMKKKGSKGCSMLYIPFVLGAFMVSTLISLLLHFNINSVVFFISIVFTGPALLFGTLYYRRIVAFLAVSSRLRSGEVEPQFIGRHRLEINENYLELQYSTISMQRYYSGIQKIADYSKGTLIHLTPQEVILIPNTAFTDVRERGKFLNYIQSKISQAKNVGVSKENMDENVSSSSYVVEFTWDEDKYINALTKANRLIFTTRLGWTIGLIICTLIGIFCGYAAILSLIRVLAAPPDEREFLHFLPIVFYSMFGYVFLMGLVTPFAPWMKKVIRSNIDNGVIHRDYFCSQALCFKNDRITELRRMNSTDYMYGKVHCIKQDSDNVYILLKGRKLVLIPISAFASDEQKQEIIYFVEDKIHRK